MADFHFLRGEYLWLILPALLAIFLWVKKSKLSGQWQHVIAPALQPYVLKKTEHSLQKTPVKLILLGCVLLAILAMAGPSWQKQSSQVYTSQAGLVIALDLSLSMTAQDVAPSRLQRAKYKITDILNQVNDKNIALLAYAGDAHMVSPLTQDSNTIKAMLPALDPYIMPTGGSNLVRLAEQAVALFEQSNSQPRQLLLVTDGVESQDIETVSQLLHTHNIQLSILAVGTEQGAPLVQPNGQFFKDSKGNVIMPSLEIDELQQLAHASGGEIRTLSNTDADINALLNSARVTEKFIQQSQDVEFDQWVDNGFYLLIPLALLSLLFFRKGLILICVLALMPISNESWAQDDSEAKPLELADLFLNKDQQAIKLFESDPAKASELFDDAKWKASSFYKAGEYEKALSQWQQFDDAESLYNQGNALAQLQKIDEAIAAYDQALDIEPNLQDAIDNKALLEQLKKQQDQQSQDGQNSDQQNSDQQNSDNKDSQQSDSQQQNANQQDAQTGDKQDSQQQQNGQQGNQQDTQQNGESSQDENPNTQPQSEAEKQREQDLKEQREQLAKQQAQEQADQETRDSKTSQMLEKSNQQMEQEQAMQHWMERIPDDPGGLLRNKFLYQYKNRQRDNEQTERKPW